jgi:hypothetical protein
MLDNSDPQQAALAIRERYLPFTAPVVNAYDVPPSYITDLPEIAYTSAARTTFKADAAGFERDLLPRVTDKDAAKRSSSRRVAVPEGNRPMSAAPAQMAALPADAAGEMAAAAGMES